MEQIELVVKMPKQAYNEIKFLKNMNTIHIPNVEAVFNAIANGTPLPKGHGRLIDADALKLTRHDIHVEAINYRHRCISVENIDEAPTIIEADKEGAEE